MNDQYLKIKKESTAKCHCVKTWRCGNSLESRNVNLFTIIRVHKYLIIFDYSTAKLLN